jgi:hypothetical protein
MFILEKLYFYFLKAYMALLVVNRAPCKRVDVALRLLKATFKLFIREVNWTVLRVREYKQLILLLRTENQNYPG